MDQLLGSERVARGFRVKFPEDVLQDNLAGQLWFGAEVRPCCFMKTFSFCKQKPEQDQNSETSSHAKSLRAEDKSMLILAFCYVINVLVGQSLNKRINE